MSDHELRLLDVTAIEDDEVSYVGTCICGWNSKVHQSRKMIEGWHSAHVKGNPKINRDGRRPW